jgi:hypothetical protein
LDNKSLLSSFLATTTRPEVELLLYCARTYVDPTTKEQIKKLLQQNIDWNYLIQTSTRHRVTPLLYWSLNLASKEAVPKPILFQLRNFFHINAQHSLFLTRELVNLLNLFRESRIPAIPFKGPSLALSVYGNLVFRQFSDLDFLVEKQSFQKALDLLISQGYQVTVNVPWEVHVESCNSSYSIDLHQEIVPKHLSSSLNSTYLWEHLESILLEKNVVPTFTPEVYLLVLCLNGTKECWNSLNRICDVAELIRSHPHMDWQQIIEQSQKMGFMRLIFIGLLLAQNLLGTDLPDFILEQMHSDSVANSVASRLHTQLFSEICEPYGAVETTFFHIKTRERWKDKIKSFLGLMILSGWLHPTKRDRDVIPLPTQLSFIYYLIRPIRVLWRYKHFLFQRYGNG